LIAEKTIDNTGGHNLIERRLKKSGREVAKVSFWREKDTSLKTAAAVSKKKKGMSNPQKRMIEPGRRLFSDWTNARGIHVINSDLRQKKNRKKPLK